VALLTMFVSSVMALISYVIAGIIILLRVC
jgi:hypothetical protein